VKSHPIPELVLQDRERLTSMPAATSCSALSTEPSPRLENPQFHIVPPASAKPEDRGRVNTSSSQSKRSPAETGTASRRRNKLENRGRFANEGKREASFIWISRKMF